MKKQSVARSSLVLSALLALAAAPAGAQAWNGAFITIGAGANQAPGSGDHFIFDTNQDGTYNDTVMTSGGANAFSPGGCKGIANGAMPQDGCYDDSNRASLSARIGYDWQMGHLVIGLLGDYNSLKLTSAVSGFGADATLGSDSYTLARSFRSISAVRVRLGYGTDNWLVYATAGAASAKFHHAFMTSNSLNTFTATPGGKTKSGYQAGLGLEHRIDGHWSMGLEYLRTRLDDQAIAVHVGPGAGTFASNPFLLANPAGTDMRRGEDRLNIDSLTLTMTYRFGGL